jgi:hypothetical protein
VCDWKFRPQLPVLRGFSRNVKQDSEENAVSVEAPKARCGRTAETSITGSRLCKIQMFAGIIPNYAEAFE